MADSSICFGVDAYYCQKYITTELNMTESEIREQIIQDQLKEEPSEDPEEESQTFDYRIFFIIGVIVLVVAVGVVFAFSAFGKPLVFVAGVIYNKIHYHLYVVLVQQLYHLVEILHCAVFGIDVSVIAYVVAVVGVGRTVQRTEPDCVNA